MAKAAKATLQVENLDAVADRGYFNSQEILACEEAGITVTLPKPMTSNSKAEGRFGKQDFRYLAEQDVYICPAGARLAYSFTTEEKGLTLRRYATTACQNCTIKRNCTTSKERRITRWEHEHVLDAVQRRLDECPDTMRQRRETVEHRFGHELVQPPRRLDLRTYVITASGFSSLALSAATRASSASIVNTLERVLCLRPTMYEVMS
jgi:hypothetical protein